jgi:surface protein
LNDYNKDISSWPDIEKKAYIEGKNDINEKNIEIYINDKKIRFNYKYKSNEKGEIKVKFNILLTSTSYMFRGRYSLLSIDLTSFNTSNVQSMHSILSGCKS